MLIVWKVECLKNTNSLSPHVSDPPAIGSHVIPPIQKFWRQLVYINPKWSITSGLHLETKVWL